MTSPLTRLSLTSSYFYFNLILFPDAASTTLNGFPLLTWEVEVLRLRLKMSSFRTHSPCLEEAGMLGGVSVSVQSQTSLLVTCILPSISSHGPSLTNWQTLLELTLVLYILRTCPLLTDSTILDEGFFSLIAVGRGLLSWSLYPNLVN